MIMNKFPIGFWNYCALGDQFTEVRYDHHDANWYENDAEEVAGDWLAPGQLNVYRIN